TYFWQIVGKNSFGTAASAVNSFTTGCSYTLNPPSASASASGGSSSVTVTSAGTCSWTATANVSWLHVTSGSPGNGTRTLNYSVDANGTSSARSGTITIAGVTFTVNQSAPAGSATYTLTPNSANPSAAGGPATTSLTTSPAGAPWSLVSNNLFITFTG